MEEEMKRRPGRPPRVRGTTEETAGMPTWEESPAFDEDVVPGGSERVIVARGKTLVMPHPTKTKILRMGEDGKAVRTPIQQDYGEGCEVSLEKEEAERLINLGIVHRPGEAQMIPAALSEGSRVVEIGTPRQTNVSPVNNAMRT